MENYTKFKLKSRDELLTHLEGKDNIFVIACNKCYKAFETVEEPELEEFVSLLREQGKTVTGSLNIDFVCNKVQTDRKLSMGADSEEVIPAETEHVAVISCGLGIQTIAELTGKSVIACANTINRRGTHGMALTDKACDACAQCYLNLTGGICPVVDCTKSLLNGQCGGAKNGKCEADPEKDCAWEKIQQRLASQGRLEELLAENVQLRDYSRVNSKKIGEYVKSVRDSRFAGYYGGVHPSERKERTEGLALVRFPEPKVAVMPMSMHLGAPAVPCVEVGDKVAVGQKIAEAGGFISAPIHASISGTVVAIEERPHATAGKCMSVIIENDGLGTIAETVKPAKPLDELTPDEIVEIVKEAGIVGMGGAGFPTCVKLKPASPVDTIILNGCECEPILTADHRLMLEFADDIIFGLRAIMKTTGAPRGVIVIEDNKPDAIELMESKVADIPDMEVCVARTKYPQGAEKTLIKRVTGRKVPSGKLPADVGCIVDNVSTVKAIADAIKPGMPLVERIITVTGERIPNPQNFIAKLGTNIADLVAECGGITGEDYTVKAGGPMMGFVQTDLNIPVMKGSNGLIAIDTDHSVPVDCIKCGRCVDVCPQELSPLYFQKYADDENWVAMRDHGVMDCVECRSCEFICSSKIPLVQKIKAGKAAVRGMK